MRTFRFLLLALVPVFAFLGACSSNDDESSSKTSDAATGDLAGETIVLYSGRDEKLVQPIIDAFTEDTGIKVDVRYGDSAEMGAQLLEEGDATPAHVFYSQEVGSVGVLANAGLMAPLPDEIIERVDERFRPGEGKEWVGVTGRSRVIVYNPDKLEELGLDLPAGVMDLTDKQYAGQVAFIPGNAGFQAFITGFRVQDGDDAARQWLEAMQANDVVTTIESSGDLLEAVNNGDVAIGLINHYYWARHENRDKLVAKLIFPAGDDPGALVNATAVGITKKAADNAAALAFVEYLLSEKGQNTFVAKTWEYPLVGGIADPEGVPPLESLEGPALDLTDLESLEATQAMLTQLGLLS